MEGPMPESIEKLQKLDEHVQSAISLLTQADQAFEQAHQVYHEYSSTVKDPPDLVSAIKAIQDHLHKCADQHNQLVAQIRQAQDDPAKQAEDDNPCERRGAPSRADLSVRGGSDDRSRPLRGCNLARPVRGS
jgi:hypothetical protein